MSAVHLRQPFESDGSVDAEAVWVGSIDLDGVTVPDEIVVDDGGSFSSARLLVLDRGHVRGFVTVAVAEGRVDAAELASAAAELPLPGLMSAAAAPPPMSVVICTRDRQADLRRCLTAVMRVDYGEREVIVVDSAPSSDQTRDVVDEFDAVRYVRVDRPGVARARNAGVRAATHEHIASVDDDVVVHPQWLHGLAAGFAARTDVGCVTGLVASGELATTSQRYFDRRVTWSRSVEPCVFQLAQPPAAYPLFPFQFGAYGTGARATTRSLLHELGGYDEALGAGSPTGGGEDIDWFTRVVLSGRTLVYQPDSVAWHRHRRDEQALGVRFAGYGVGLGAVLAKLAGDRTARRAMLPLVARGAAHSVRMLTRPHHGGGQPKGYALTELRGVLRGPWALRAARRDGLARPLHRG